MRYLRENYGRANLTPKLSVSRDHAACEYSRFSSLLAAWDLFTGVSHVSDAKRP